MEQILYYKPDSGCPDDAPDSAAVLCRARSGSAPASKETLDWLFGRGA